MSKLPDCLVFGKAAAATEANKSRYRYRYRFRNKTREAGISRDLRFMAVWMIGSDWVVKFLSEMPKYAIPRVLSRAWNVLVPLPQLSKLPAGSV